MKLPSALQENVSNVPAGIRPGSQWMHFTPFISFGVPFLESGTPGQNPTPTDH